MITWSHYLYPVANWDRVLYNNESPQFNQVGPYDYAQASAYDSLDFSQTDTVSGTYNQHTVFSTGDASIDTPMWLPNQAAMGTWWRTQNQEMWKTYI